MKTAIIIGAGPAGLTAAYELLTKTDIVPIIIEADKQVGGISKTIHHNGNKIDIGGHRFFSKSDKVIKWWLHFLPLENNPTVSEIQISYQNQQKIISPDSATLSSPDQVMLIRKRKSRIYYRNKLFDYPLKLSGSTLSRLGFVKTLKTGSSYLQSKLFPVKPETSLEDFFINRFGNELYQTFFKDYTEKVWGVPCKEIPASWGQQRIKNLDVGKLIRHAVTEIFTSNKSLNQKGISTSLIEQFMYPKFGPGQMWESVAASIRALGGKIYLNAEVSCLTGDGISKIQSAKITDRETGVVSIFEGDYFLSTMPVRELVTTFEKLPVPQIVLETASRLEYRDFLIVGLLTNELTIRDYDGSNITDNWIYIQDKKIKAGRLQFFHNWSPGMIAAPGLKWIGVEYFCNETEDFWKLTDAELSDFARSEMEAIGVLQGETVTDSIVVRVNKAYPSYYGAYSNFSIVRDFLDKIPNLFPIGRNGMHRYNNSDHSMLTAMTAVENIIQNRVDKSNIWEINTSDDYHESDSQQKTPA